LGSLETIGMRELCEIDNSSKEMIWVILGTVIS
jgi:hypothetical protein